MSNQHIQNMLTWIEQTLGRVAMTNSAIPIAPPKITLVEETLVIVANTSSVCDRDCGEPRQGCSRSTFLLEDVPCIATGAGEKWLLEFYERHLRAIYAHQFNEAFHVDGVRVHEPHPNQV